MKFSDLDTRMRQYEIAHDYCIPEGFYVVARLDGKCFHKLTANMDHPFDDYFNAMMRHVCATLMLSSDVKFSYGYTQSDEISLLLSDNCVSFNRKERKLVSVLAGIASASASIFLDTMAVFDCRLSILPSTKLVVDYFSWRQADCSRNALNSMSYWYLRDKGYSASAASNKLDGMGAGMKHELLHSLGANFADLKGWQKNGVGFYFEEFERTGIDPRTGEECLVKRASLKVDEELPIGDEYRDFVRKSSFGG
jgi:tRNA(His) guanylyltransferase